MFKIKIAFLLFFSIITQVVYSQSSFAFNAYKNKEKIRFELVNNLILIPVDVNGVTLKFLLDSGVGSTLLFNNQNVARVYFEQLSPMRIVGLGDEGEVSASLSKGNTIRIASAVAKGQDILIIDETNFEFMQRMGTQIDGIIGYALLKDFLVGVNYQSKKITLYPKHKNLQKITKKSFQIPIKVEGRKPHIPLDFEIQPEQKQSGYFLIDTGSSDALWLFESDSLQMKLPVFSDFLGRGINGNIFGDRGKIHQLDMGTYSMNQVKVAYPDKKSFQNLRLMKGRVGSVGGEILKRFQLLFDYENQYLYLKPIKGVSEPFYYNMSGIEIQHSGVELVKERITNQLGLMQQQNDNNPGIEIFMVPQYRLELRPVIEIFEVRPKSPAAQAGVLKGDILLRINGKIISKINL